MRSRTWIDEERARFRRLMGMTYEQAEQKWIDDRKNGVWVKQDFMDAVNRMAYLECCWKETKIHPYRVKVKWEKS